MPKFVCNNCGFEKETVVGINNCPECKKKSTMERKED